MLLNNYKKKRNFTQTPEPKGIVKKKSSRLRFVVQKHHASHLHYDFRLEMAGVLKSWAIPKGPSLNPKDKRLAIMVEDHPFKYKDFEGVIPAGNYGAGGVIIWDEGTYEILDSSSLAKGHLNFNLDGKKLRGEFTLVKFRSTEKNTWLLIKRADKYATSADILKADQSVRTGKALQPKKVAGEKKKPPKKTSVKMPSGIKPMLAYLIDKPFNREGWIFEIKWDGYRIIAYVNNKQVTLFTRNLKDYSQIFSPVTHELSQHNISAILDGEMVVLDSSGYSHFQLLQQFQKSGQGQLVYMVFDLLWLNGEDLRKLPLSERKKLLLENLPAMEHIRISEHIETVGKDFFKVASARGLEGIMGKDYQSPYLSGKRSRSWLKMKATKGQEAVIAGYTAPRGSRPYIGALILGVYAEDQLVYIGHTSGKLNEKALGALKKKLDSLAQPVCPFSKKPKTNSAVTWVKPVLVCEVTFTEWTEDGHLRHPVFIGLREDKPAKLVHREQPMATTTVIDSKHEKNRVMINHHHLTLTNLNKVYWPAEKYTKGQLIAYYQAVAKFILPHLQDRPEVLHRHPQGIAGESFFQKNIEKTPSWIKTKVFYSEHAQRSVRYMICQDEAALIYMINLGCIETNPWLARIQSPENPDYCVLDLDPENIAFEAVILTANTIHKILERAGVTNYCKTSGKRGLHIYIPLSAGYSFEQSRQFAEIIADLAHQQLPDITSLVRSPAQRQGKVYIDCLQNRPHQTLASPYSVRPVPGATVSTPLRWQEVNKRLSPTQFTIKNILARLEKIGDLWAELDKSPVDLEASLQAVKKLSNHSR